jgi:hypothetical protein
MLIAVEAHYKVKPIIYTKGIMTILKEEFSDYLFFGYNYFYRENMQEERVVLAIHRKASIRNKRQCRCESLMATYSN